LWDQASLGLVYDSRVVMGRGGQMDETTDKLGQLKENTMGFLKGLFQKAPKKPSVDVKTVEKALEDALWPLLKAHGFDAFKGRTAWRHQEKKIDVVEIQFFSKSQARKLGITPYSFALPVGCFFSFIPSYGTARLADQNGVLLPEEVWCHLRKAPSKTLKQSECKMTGVWYIDPFGKYLERAVTDVKHIIEVDILPWLDRFDRLEEVLRTLLEDEEDQRIRGWGFGRKDSPLRFYLIGFVALKLQQWQLALDALQQALGTGSRPALAGNNEVNEHIRRAIARAEAALRGSA
jgi:hypothetical protein